MIKTKKWLETLLVIGMAGGMIACGGDQILSDIEVDTDGDGIYDHQESNGFYYLDGEFFTLERVMTEQQWSQFSQLEEDGVEPPQNKRSPFKLAYKTMNDNDFVRSAGDGEVIINFDKLINHLSAAFKDEYGDTHRFYKSGSNVAGSFRNILLRLNQDYDVLEPTYFDGDPIPYYFTNPDIKSSDRDPYTDYEEAISSFITGNVTLVHPSVSAFPVIEARLKSYQYTPKQEIRDNSGGKIGSSVTHSVSRSSSQTEGWEASVSATSTVSFTPSVTVTASAGISGSYTSGVEIGNSGQNTEEFNWSQLTISKLDCAADLRFTANVQNMGTAPAEDVELIFQVKIGNRSLPAFAPEFTFSLDPNGIPVPASSDLTYDAGCISLSELQYLQMGGAISLETTVESAKIPFQGENDELIQFGSEWSTYFSMAANENSRINYSVFDQNEALVTETFYVDPLNRNKVLTLRDAIKMTLTLPCDGQGRASLCINDNGDVIRSSQTYVGIVRHDADAPDERLEELLGDSTDALDVKLEPKWEYHIITTKSQYPTLQAVGVEVDDANVTVVVRATDELGMAAVQFCENNVTCFDMSYDAADYSYRYTPAVGRVPTGNEFVKVVNSRDKQITENLELPRSWHSQISVQGDARTNFGSWSNWVMCPVDQYAKGFRQKVDGTSFDDTGLNRVSLYCSDKHGNGNKQIIAGGDSGWGSWSTAKNCVQGEHLLAFNLKSEPRQGLDTDDAGATGIRFKCGDDVELVAENDDPDGSYVGYKSANNAGYRICGMRSRIEPEQGTFTDDTGLNNVEFQYCDYSGVFQ